MIPCPVNAARCGWAGKDEAQPIDEYKAGKTYGAAKRRRALRSERAWYVVDPQSPSEALARLDAMVRSHPQAHEASGNIQPDDPFRGDSDIALALRTMLRAIAHRSEITVAYDDTLPPTVSAETRIVEGQYEILLNPQNEGVEESSALAHELAHVELRHLARPRGPYEAALAEVEAESVAFVLCASRGLDTSSFSVPYVALYSHVSDYPSDRAGIILEVVAHLSAWHEGGGAS